MFTATTCLFCLALVAPNSIDSKDMPNSFDLTTEEIQDWPKVPTYTVPTRAFKIPFRASNDADHIVLYISSDKGRTWREYAKAAPTKNRFIVHTPSDGMYWFTAQTVDRNKQCNPPDIRKTPPHLKVKVDTRAAP